MTETHTKTDIKSEIKSLVLVVCIAFMIRIFVIELFFVPTGSMKETILENDYIFSTKYSYGYSKYSLPFSPNLFSGRIFASEPQRGDIIIMRPPHNMETRYIKRLIALPNDKIEIIDDVTYINDIPLPRREMGTILNEQGEEFIKYRETLPNGLNFYTYKMKNAKLPVDRDRSNFGPVIVPEGEFFFMGDNRDDSGDSRYQLGFVPFEYLIAKAQFILFSTKEVLWSPNLGLVDQLAQFGSWIVSIRFNRLFKGLYKE